MAKKKNQSVEVRIEIDGLYVTAVPNKRSPDFDKLLQLRGAESFVFIPLASLGKVKARALKKVRSKAKLPDMEWYDGELHSLDSRAIVPGVLAFDVRRRTAREIAETIGVNQFIWGASGVPVETHDVNIFEDGTSYSWKSAKARAYTGLADMVASARHVSALSQAVEESQTTMDKFWQLVAVVLAAAVAGGAVKAGLLALFAENDSTSWREGFVHLTFYPFVIPALFVGIYLRVLMKRGEQQARDFTAAEAEKNWIKVAPHLLALWGLCWMAVVILTGLQTVPNTDLGLFGRTDGVMTSFIICVWMLLPIAHSQGLNSLFKSAAESGFTAAVSILMIKISLYITNLISDALLGILTSMLPFEIPEWLQTLISSIVNIGAEVFFVAVLLGYAWSRTRQQFMRL